MAVFFSKDKHEKNLDDFTVIERVPEHTRQLTVNVFTAAGWIAGTLRLPPEVRIADHLNIAPEFFPLTDVFMEAHSKEMPFFAMRRDAIHFMTIDVPDEINGVDDPTVYDEHKVDFLTTFGRMRGKVYTRQGVRLTDKFMKDNYFVATYNCRYEIRHPKEKDTDRAKVNFLLIGTDQVIGFSERVKIE